MKFYPNGSRFYCEKTKDDTTGGVNKQINMNKNCNFSIDYEQIVNDTIPDMWTSKTNNGRV